MLQSLREETEGKLQMLLPLRKNSLTSKLKEVLAFFRAFPASTWGHYSQTLIFTVIWWHPKTQKKCQVSGALKTMFSAFGAKKNPNKRRGNAFLPNRTGFALPRGGGSAGGCLPGIGRGGLHVFLGRNARQEKVKIEIFKRDWSFQARFFFTGP